MELLSKAKKYSLITIAVSAILGLLFVIFPNQSLKYISLAIGISMIAMGVAYAIGYFASKFDTFNLVSGIVLVVVGIVVCIRYRAIVSIIVFLLGLVILSLGLFNLAASIKVIVSSLISGWFTLLLSVATSVFGVIAITNSNGLTQTIIELIGVGLIIYAVLGIIAYVQIKKLTHRVKQAVDSTNDIDVDATVTDIDD